jgi:hypothetical protein
MTWQFRGRSSALTSCNLWLECDDVVALIGRSSERNVAGAITQELCRGGVNGMASDVDSSPRKSVVTKLAAGSSYCEQIEIRHSLPPQRSRAPHSTKIAYVAAGRFR